MNRLARLAASACAVIALVAFFLPWVSIKIRSPELVSRIQHTGRITLSVERDAHTMTGELGQVLDLPQQLSGYELPRVVRRSESQLALATWEVMSGRRSELDLQCQLAYLVPALVIGLATALLLFGRRLAVRRGIAAICLLLAIIGFWQLGRLSTHAAVVVPRYGAWLSVWTYGALAAIGIAGGFGQKDGQG